MRVSREREERNAPDLVLKNGLQVSLGAGGQAVAVQRWRVDAKQPLHILLDHGGALQAQVAVEVTVRIARVGIWTHIVNGAVAQLHLVESGAVADAGAEAVGLIHAPGHHLVGKVAVARCYRNVPHAGIVHHGLSVELQRLVLSLQHDNIHCWQRYVWNILLVQHAHQSGACQMQIHFQMATSV